MTRLRDPLFLAALIAGTLPAVFSYIAIGVAIPHLEGHFGVGHSAVHWVATAFIAAMMGGMLAAGPLLTRLGIAASLRTCAVLFSAASLWAATADHFWSLVAARFVMGLAGGLGQPLALIVLYEAFGDDSRGAATSLFGVTTAACASLAALLAGILLDALGWRSIFWAPVPFALALLLAAHRAPVRPRSSSERLDWAGLTAVLIGLLAALGIDTTQSQSWRTSASAAVAILCIVVVIARQRTSDRPLFDPELFRYTGYLRSAACATIYGALMFGLAYALPIYLQLGLGQTATAAGAWLVIPGVALVAAIHIGGPLTDRASFRPVLLSGFGLLAIGLGGLGLPTPFGTLITVMALATVARAGMGLVFCGINAGATRTVPDRLLSKVPGSINFFRLLGGAVGVRALAALLEPTAGQGSLGTGADRDFVGGFLFLATLALLAIPIATGIQRIPSEHANASLHERNQP